MYHILPYSYNKKIDIFKNNNYICSIGQIGMADYPTIGRNDANTEGRKPLYRVYKVGPVKLYTVISILRF